MLPREREIYRIEEYRKGTKDKSIIFKPDIKNGFQFYVGADFTDSWDKVDVDNTIS